MEAIEQDPKSHAAGETNNKCRHDAEQCLHAADTKHSRQSTQFKNEPPKALCISPACAGEERSSPNGIEQRQLHDGQFNLPILSHPPLTFLVHHIIVLVLLPPQVQDGHRTTSVVPQPFCCFSGCLFAAPPPRPSALQAQSFTGKNAPSIALRKP
ncbi:unnamed protein product, partial [Ectocarpus fasciculatus]